MAGIDRVHGSVISPITLHGGYQISFYRIRVYSDVFTADTLDATGNIIVEGGFTKAIKWLQTIGTIVYIGTRHNQQIVVGFDSSTARGEPNADNKSLITVQDAIYNTIYRETNSDVVVYDISGLAAGSIPTL